MRVAVIGGGCGALTAAYELTRPEHEGRYQVTVYQMGWRLGGKGASGRGVADRIEEHGLHLWMGFYENAFRMMRECYAQLPEGESRRMRDWREAFTPAPHVGVTDLTAEGSWDVWVAHFPPGQGLPGDPPDRASPFTVAGYLRQSAMLVTELLRSAQAREPVPAGTDEGREPRGSGAPASGPTGPADASAVAAAADRLVRYGQLATTTALYEASDILRQALDQWLPGTLRSSAFVLTALIEAMAAASRRQLEKMASEDDELRRIWTVIDLILAILRGSTAHRLALDPRGFDALNDHDWREWLRTHGASEQSLDSGFMRGIYDLCFAYEGGDVERPRLAAGVALRGAMRMFFTYRGALFWRMNAGMGDVVFTPLYEVLKARGVRFEFFHKLTNVRLAPARSGQTPYVKALELDVQAKLERGHEYAPLVDVHGVPSWPSEPDWTQLEGGALLRQEGRDFEAHWDRRREGTRTLRVGTDFDLVVLGVPVAVLPTVAGELIRREPRWADTVRHVRTVPTQSLQVWLKKSVDDLGWTRPQVNLSGFVEPFDTWADMRHLIPEESWPDPIGAIAYFCSVLPDLLDDPADVDEAHHRAQLEAVRDNALRFLDRDVGHLWPGALKRDGSFDWELLASGNGKGPRGSGRLDTQFWVANVNPTDRYTLSLPGSIEYRLSPLDLHFDNLTIAGDWTATGLDSGCIESAVMSGKLAAHALSGAPRLEDIVGYDHP